MISTLTRLAPSQGSGVGPPPGWIEGWSSMTGTAKGPDGVGVAFALTTMPGKSVISQDITKLRTALKITSVVTPAISRKAPTIPNKIMEDLDLRFNFIWLDPEETKALLYHGAHYTFIGRQYWT